MRSGAPQAHDSLFGKFLCNTLLEEGGAVPAIGGDQRWGLQYGYFYFVTALIAFLLDWY